MFCISFFWSYHHQEERSFLKNGYLCVSTQYIGWVLILLKSYSKLNVEFEQSHLSHMAWKRLQLLKYLGHLCILHCTGEWRWKSEPWRTHCAWLGAIPLMQEQSINSSEKKPCTRVLEAVPEMCVLTHKNNFNSTKAFGAFSLFFISFWLSRPLNSPDHNESEK